MNRIRELIKRLYAPPCCRTCGAMLEDHYVVAPPEGIVRYWAHPGGRCASTTRVRADEAA